MEGHSLETTTNAIWSQLMNINKTKIGEGIAFAALCGSAVFLEVSGFSADGLWMVVFLWIFLGWI